MSEPTRCPFCGAAGQKSRQEVPLNVFRCNFNCGSTAMQAEWNLKTNFYMNARCYEAAVARTNRERRAAA